MLQHPYQLQHQQQHQLLPPTIIAGPAGILPKAIPTPRPIPAPIDPPIYATICSSLKDSLLSLLHKLVPDPQWIVQSCYFSFSKKLDVEY